MPSRVLVKPLNSAASLGAMVTAVTICAGAFGVTAGILAVKIFQKSEGRASARP
jgi:hypothetical protein